MPLIIDVYNVLHTTGILPPDIAGLDVEGLRKLIAISRYRDQYSLLVCDGTGDIDQYTGFTSSVRSPYAFMHFSDLPIGSGAGKDMLDGVNDSDTSSKELNRITILYAGRGRDADSLIEKLISDNSAPHRLTVVSSDHRIKRAAQKRKSYTINSEAFLQRLAHDHAQYQRGLSRPAKAYEVPLDMEAIHWWLLQFGFRLNDDSNLNQIKSEVDKSQLPPILTTDSTNSNIDTPSAEDEVSDSASINDLLEDYEKNRGSKKTPDWWNDPDKEIDVDSIDTGDFIPDQ